jgi:hypothetical protein
MQTEASTSSAYRTEADARRETREPDAQDGIFGTWGALGVGMVESSVRTSTRVLRTVLRETEVAVGATIGFVDSAQQAMIRAAKAVNEGGFSLATEALNRSERAALVVLRQTQAAGDRASELAAATSHAVLGNRGNTATA